MPYTIKETTNASKIEERECASDSEIKFSNFTSCIGVIARKGDKLTGVHLSVYDDQGNIFGEDAQDVDRVLKLVLPKPPQKADAVTVFGCIDFWRNSESDKVRAAFGKLTGTLKDKVGKDVELYHQSNKKDGEYGAKIGGTGIIITFLK
jgi:hypothetical protein